jgi:hypothetical protein
MPEIHPEGNCPGVCALINQVPFDVGFESKPHFNWVFRRYAGVSPVQYRALRRRKVGILVIIRMFILVPDSPMSIFAKKKQIDA